MGAWDGLDAPCGKSIDLCPLPPSPPAVSQQHCTANFQPSSKPQGTHEAQCSRLDVGSVLTPLVPLQMSHLVFENRRHTPKTIKMTNGRAHLKYAPFLSHPDPQDAHPVCSPSPSALAGSSRRPSA
jgi:hypothetical protein